MTAEFLVTTTSRFDRELKKLAAQHPGLPEMFRQVIVILRADPYNRGRQHPIKKLEAVAAGEGQHRIRTDGFDSATTLTAGRSSSRPARCAVRIPTDEISLDLEHVEQPKG